MKSDPTLKYPKLSDRLAIMKAFEFQKFPFPSPHNSIITDWRGARGVGAGMDFPDPLIRLQIKLVEGRVYSRPYNWFRHPITLAELKIYL